MTTKTVFDKRTKSYIRTTSTYDLAHTPPLKHQIIELWTEKKEDTEKKVDG